MLRVGSRLGWKWIGWVLWLYDSSLSTHYQSCLSFLLKSAVGLKEESSRNQSSGSQWFKQLFSQTEPECPWHPHSRLLTSSVFSLPPIPNQIKAAGECVGLCWLKLWIGPNISFLPHYFLLFGIFSSNFDRQIILEFKGSWFSLSIVKIYLCGYEQMEESLWANLPLCEGCISVGVVMQEIVMGNSQDVFKLQHSISGYDTESIRYTAPLQYHLFPQGKLRYFSQENLILFKRLLHDPLKCM